MIITQSRKEGHARTEVPGDRGIGRLGTHSEEGEEEEEL
jgi:hypothetical protein